MKTTWFTVATGSEQFVKMACLLSKNWKKHNDSELVIVTDSDIPEKMGLSNLKSNKWQNIREWGWHFKFEAYDKIWEYNKSDIFCLLDSDVMPVKGVNEEYIKSLSFAGCHIAMEEDMIGDGVGEWWSFKNPYLSNYMLNQIKKNHKKASQAWHGNGGFHFWHRDLLKKKKFINRANEIFSDLSELSKKTGSGFPCEEPVQQTMVQELTPPSRIHEHSLEQGLSKYIQETVFWPDVPDKPVTMNKTSYFTGKRRWTCEPSNIHLISAKNKLNELSCLNYEKFERELNKNICLEFSNKEVESFYDYSMQNIFGDALLSKKTGVLIIKDANEHIRIDKKIFKNKFEEIYIENIDTKNIKNNCRKLKEKSVPLSIVIFEDSENVKKLIYHSIKYVKNGGIIAIKHKNSKDKNIIYNIMGTPHHTINNNMDCYLIDVVRRRYKKMSINNKEKI